MTLSATVIAQDEEDAIGECIASVRAFCDEVLVVDEVVLLVVLVDVVVVVDGTVVVLDVVDVVLLVVVVAGAAVEPRMWAIRPSEFACIVRSTSTT